MQSKVTSCRDGMSTKMVMLLMKMTLVLLPSALTMKLAVANSGIEFRLSCTSIYIISYISIYIAEVVARAGKDRRENSSGANSNRLITSVIILSSSSVISSALNKL